ncbi:hypothetical protein ACLKA7_001934 [Drosophila subpalustris]
MEIRDLYSLASREDIIAIHLETSLHTGFVRAKISDIWFYSVYLAPSLSLADFTRILDSLVADARSRHPVVIGGDFNAWAEEWGSVTTNSRGRGVLESTSSLDLAFLNTIGQQTVAIEPAHSGSAHRPKIKTIEKKQVGAATVEFARQLDTLCQSP